MHNYLDYVVGPVKVQAQSLSRDQSGEDPGVGEGAAIGLQVAGRVGYPRRTDTDFNSVYSSTPSRPFSRPHPDSL